LISVKGRGEKEGGRKKKRGKIFSSTHYRGFGSRKRGKKERGEREGGTLCVT